MHLDSLLAARRPPFASSDVFVAFLFVLFGLFLRSSGLLVLLGGLLRHLASCCGASWGPLRVLLGPLASLLEPLRVSWKSLGVSWGTLGYSWRPSWGGIEAS